MIPGLSSSSGISMAVRTASKARATMDDMSRQIATGQKVSSVKDDGAAWARAAGLKSQQASILGRQTLTTILESESRAQGAEVDGLRTLFERARDVLLSAKAQQPGSLNRQRLQNEFNGIIASIDSGGFQNDTIATGYALQADGKWGILAGGADPVLGNRTTFIVGNLPGGYATGWISTNPSVPIDFRTTDVVNGSGATLDTAIWWANEFSRWSDLNGQQVAGDQVWLDGVQKRDAHDMDRIEGAISALTDADLGKASTARANAETRQQLALSTVRQAISAYGSYANGLLGNVARTQRRVMA